MTHIWRRSIGLAAALLIAVSAVLLAMPGISSGALASAPASFALPPTDCPVGVPLAPGSIATIAGGGMAQGDGGQATDALIDVTVGGLAIEDTGAVLFSGYYEPQVRMVGVDGILSTIADPAAGAPFHSSDSLALGTAGETYVADGDAGRVWQIGPRGVVTAVAGTGQPGSSGDEGPALDAAIHPFHAATGPDGSLYLDDGARVRVITADGTIHAFAGTEVSGFGGDSGPAVDAQLGGADTADESYAEVMGMVSDTEGNLYISDTGNQRIRRVDRTGIITTVAGTGVRGYSGDGGPAVAAIFEDPVDLALDDAGNLYISDHHNSVVRRVDTRGVISTVAGTVPKHTVSSGDCGPATAAGLQPWAIDVRDGYLYIGDMTIQGIGRIRVVKL